MEADLERFVRAQDRVWAEVSAELRLGQKRTHWMWFVFPQLAALGRSETAKFFGLRDRAHAELYLAHPILRERLTDCSELVLGHADLSAERIFGAIDAQKLRSSMTLFGMVTAETDTFAKVIEQKFDGEPCPITAAIFDRSHGFTAP